MGAGRAPGEPCPLSLDQERLWFMHQLDPASPAYNIYGAERFRGVVHLAALARALDEVARRHEILRTVFVAREGLPVQEIAPHLGVRVPLVDLGGLPAELRAAAVNGLAGAHVRRPFLLTALPLFRVLLLREARDSLVCVTVFHHIVMDWVSYYLLQRELASLYATFAAGLPSRLPPPAAQYADFALWERQWSRQEAVGRQLEYWRRHLLGAPDELRLPADHPRPALATGRGARRRLTIAAGTTSTLRRLAQARRMTHFMLLLGLFQILLFRLTGEETVVVGSPIARRHVHPFEGLIGFLLNHLVFCTRLSARASVGEVLEQVRQVALDAYAHQDVPFARLVEELRPERDLGRMPLTQVALLVLNPEELGAVRFGDVEVSPYLVDGGSSKFDLTLGLWDSGGSAFAGWMEYSSDLFEPATVVRWAECLETLLAAAGEDPDRPLSLLPLLGPAQRHQLLAEWNDTGAAAPSGRTFVALFEAQVEHSPGAPAVLCGGESLSFRDLDRRANRLALGLRRLGVGPEKTVALCLERSAEMVVAALAVLKAGGAYLPLDPSLPVDRLAFLAVDAGARVVLARGGAAAALANRSLPVASPDAVAANLDAGEPAGRRPPAAGPGNLAYVIYTSGSTGEPKGVEITHAALLNLVAWHVRAFAVVPGDRAAQVCAVGFDAAVWDLWPILAAGGLVDLADEQLRRQPEELRDWLVERRISLAFVPTALAEAMLQVPWPQRASLRVLLTGGDTLHLHPPPDLPCVLINAYGPTESTVVATAGVLRPRRGAGPLPGIGRPIDGIEILLADSAGQLVPIGCAGELCIGGAGLARGYRGQPAGTAERFVPHPWSERPGARLYRTGDLARQHPGGEIEFLGRTDGQLKVRGFRIEPGEIEAALRTHGEVREAAVLARTASGRKWDRQLVAFVAPHAGRPPSPAELHDHLAARLPGYMLPAEILILAALPRTAAGKLDRPALADAGAAGRLQPERSFASPRTPVEEILAGIWSEVLGIERVGALDEFFALGGHSLLAAQVQARLRQAFEVELPLKRLFEAVTVRELSRSVEAAIAHRWAAPPRIGRRSGGAATAPLSLEQEPLWRLDRRLPGTDLFNIPLGIRLAGALSPGVLRRALAAVAARHETLRTTLADGDGSSFQRVHAAGMVPLPVLDLAALAGPRAEDESRRVAGRFVRLSFDLGAGPLFRAALLRLGERDHCLLFSIHHIAADAWSTGVLLRDWTALYTALSGAAAGAPPPPALDELPIQYGDFAAWQRRWVETEEATALRAWWCGQLGEPRPLALPLDSPRPAAGTFTMAGQRLALAGNLSAALADLGRRERVTSFMSLLAAFAVVLHHWTGQEDLRIGTLVANRARRETEDLIGLFVNTLVLRLDLGGGPSWQELLRRVRATVLTAFAHQELPFELVRQDLEKAAGGKRQPPPCEVMVIFQNAPLGPLELPGLDVTPWPSEEGADEAAVTLTAFDLVLVVEEGAAGLSCLLRYKTRLFEAATIARVLGELEAALSTITRDQTATI